MGPLSIKISPKKLFDDQLSMSWKKVRLGEICIIKGGIPAPKEEYFVNGEYPFIRMKDLGRYHLTNNLIKVEGFVNEEFYLNNINKVIKKGSVILPRSGSVGLNHRAVLGMDALIVSHICALEIIDNNEIFNFFLYYFLMQTDMLSITKQTTGLDAITFQDLAKISVRFPNLQTQKHIASILDKADALRQQNRLLLAHYDALLQSTFIEMFGDPVENPKGWEVKRLGECVKIVGGGTPSRDREDYFTGQICWATAKDIKSDYITNTQEHITEEAIKNSATKLVESGTILMVVKSKILMHSLPVAISKVPICFGQDLKGLIPQPSLDTLFIVIQIKIVKNELLSLARGANTEGLTLEHLNNLKIISPPLNYQQHFAKISEDIEFQKQQAKKSLAESESLFQGLLSTYFGNK